MTNQILTSDSKKGKDYSAVRRVLIWILFANLAVTIVKIGLGIFTGALAVVADGFHSLVDSSSNLIGLAAIKLAGRPADDKHPYGYRRYETIGAMAIGAMLLVAAYEIGSSIIDRLSAGVRPEIDNLSFWLVMLTLPINIVVVILEIRASKKLNSEILFADAKHTQTDLFVTASVLVSMVGVRLGWAWLDLVVAAFVVLLIGKAAFEILGDTTRWLTDRAAVDPDLIEEIVYSAPGVRFVHRIRSRGNPGAIFVDLHAKVDPGMSTSQAHAISSEVERRIIEQIDNVVEAIVHIEPSKKERPTHWEKISTDLRTTADGMGLGLHNLHIHTEGDAGFIVELHLEMRGEMSLGEAHSLADQFEETVVKRWPQIVSITTHLEPLPADFFQSGENPDPKYVGDIRKLLLNHVQSEQILKLQCYRSSEHLHAAITICLDSKLSLKQVHAETENIENDLLKQIPGLSRVIVHVEPEKQ
ncbi:MAG: cation diffusion facilitator family transporter [Chloroflexi bacterium]|jgi:cation diffusion facilitator family transporter|nr:cation diffusion facilitator family transporter [Chloroflexota bacterium]MBT3670947.1 cation diffusion facilitator family transporter [Chloroflexota bacterium]MBT4001685.1 cation diffusion facilitator family transporter [Chloroflexota bacterium]MBT4306339.1 cation diffusion facilitator family transporter [Chloroflexota bacterium]MBT4532780.1 cation diffusion facilitator family transporter [Chloroflexota bacterium]